MTKKKQKLMKNFQKMPKPKLMPIEELKSYHLFLEECIEKEILAKFLKLIQILDVIKFQIDKEDPARILFTKGPDYQVADSILEHHYYDLYQIEVIYNMIKDERVFKHINILIECLYHEFVKTHNISEILSDGYRKLFIT